MEKYTFEGTTYNVAPNRLEEFLTKFPDAVKVDEPGKINDSAIADPWWMVLWGNQKLVLGKVLKTIYLMLLK